MNEQGSTLIKQLISSIKNGNKEAEETLINVYNVLSTRVIDAEQKVKTHEAVTIVNYLTKSNDINGTAN